MTRDRHPNNPIPGAPADSLMGLGGSDGFVGQCDRERCLSTPPPPPPKSESAVTRSYPPIPLPTLPEMPLRARMLRPWMGVAGGAVLIAIVALASGNEEQVDAATAETDAAITALSFAADMTDVGSSALGAARAEAARRIAGGADEQHADDEPDTSEDEKEPEDAAEEPRREATAHDIASKGHAKTKKTKTTSKTAKAFNRDAARSAIFSAASRASGCRTKNGPTGRGRATVTIGPSGAVTGVSVSPPFTGTKSGHCVASVFRSVRIAPFSGGAVTLGKSFTVR